MKKRILGVLATVAAVAAFASPVKSDEAAKGISFTDDGAYIPTASDYVQDGLVFMLDGIENAGWGLHDESLQTGDVLMNLCGTDTVRLTKQTKIGDDYFEGPLEVSSY